MSRILIVEDEPELARALGINLRARKYDVVVARDGTAALRLAASAPPDLVILDLGLPDIDGIEVIHGLRGWTRVPIVVLSAREGQSDKVTALDAGADDYLTKPFGMDELLARIRAALRRAEPAESQPVIITDQVHHRPRCQEGLDTPRAPSDSPPPSGTCSRSSPRTPASWSARQQLLTDVWGPAYAKETNYLRVYMAQIRQKLEANPSHPRHVITEPGMGYRFEP